MTHDDQTVERVARAVFDTLVSQTTGRAPKHDYDDTLEDNREAARELARAALSAMPDAALLREALSALDSSRSAIDFYDGVQAATSDEQIAVGQDHWNWLIDAARNARAAADKIRAALGGE